MNRLAKASVSVALSFLLASSVVAQQSRIINGKPASTDDFPWIASLFITSESDPESGGGCGGSLIADKWILTAAHCFLNDEGDAVSADAASRLSVTMGSTNINSLSGNAITAEAARVIIHPDYNPDPESSTNTHDYDIALIELNRSVQATPVRLFTGSVPANLPVIVAGWGATVGDGSEASDELLHTQLVTATNSDCESAHEGSITANMFCAGGYTDNDTSDTCQGDSGGPLFVMLGQQALQLGITSFGGSETSNCGTPGSPGVYAAVSELYGFIQQYVPNSNVLNSTNEMTIAYNVYDDATETVTIPKVYADGLNYSVTLKLTNGNDLSFVLATAEENTRDNPTAVPSFFDGTANELLLPLVRVGPDIFNVRLRHLGDFNFRVEMADAP